MTKVYTVEKRYICKLVDEICDFENKPDCKSCGIYREWKESGKTIDEFQRGE